jgi:hypothetical protein
MEFLFYFCLISFVFAQTAPTGTTMQMPGEGSTTTGTTTVGLHERLHHRHPKRRVLSTPKAKTASSDHNSVHSKPEEDVSSTQFEHEVKNVKDVYACSTPDDLCTRVTEFTPVGDETLCTEVNLLIYYQVYQKIPSVSDNVTSKIYEYGYLPPGKGVTITHQQDYSSVCKKIKR